MLFDILNYLQSVLEREKKKYGITNEEKTRNRVKQASHQEIRATPRGFENKK